MAGTRSQASSSAAPAADADQGSSAAPSTNDPTNDSSHEDQASKVKRWKKGVPETSEFYYDEEIPHRTLKKTNSPSPFPPPKMDLSDAWVATILAAGFSAKDRFETWPAGDETQHASPTSWPSGSQRIEQRCLGSAPTSGRVSLSVIRRATCRLGTTKEIHARMRASMLFSSTYHRTTDQMWRCSRKVDPEFHILYRVVGKPNKWVADKQKAVKKPNSEWIADEQEAPRPKHVEGSSSRGVYAQLTSSVLGCL